MPVRLLVAAALASGALAQDALHERFEREVRPLLAERCHECHGAAKQKSGLRLDHGAFVAAGGDRGPAVVPGDPAASRLLRAVRYEDVDLQMPPKGMLAAGEIAVLERWVADGAFWPDEPVPGAEQRDTFDLGRRVREHWSWRPATAVEPPAVADTGWTRDPIDRFVLRRIEEAGLTPSPPASRATWLRRVSFDLCGLPPTPAELAAFATDTRRDAFERVVDRLLASPHYAERQARHWLDLVRFAETLGHEYDYPIQGAWHYRDYVVRAFDADLPYDRFVVEHIAGDLLSEPRRDPRDGTLESVIGPSFYWFGDQTHSPVDPRQHQADRTDNQLDVLGKTFLGLTLGCARCHDHKFDAITTRDYYAMAGILRSSRYQLTAIDAPEPYEAAAAELRSLRARHAAALTASWRRAQDAVGAAVAAARAAPDDAGPMRTWLELEAVPAADWPRIWSARTAAARDAAGREHEILADFRGPAAARGFGAWFREGHAFGDRPAPPGIVVIHRGKEDALLVHAGAAHSAALGRRLQGSLHSPSFEIDRRYLHLRIAGEGARLNVVVDGFNVIRDPIYGALKHVPEHRDLRWVTIDLDLWRGRSAYLQLHDVSVADPGDPDRRGAYPDDGWIALQRALLSSSPRLPDDAPAPASLLGSRPPDDLTELAARYRQAIAAAIDAVDAHEVTDAQAELLQWLLDRELLPARPAEAAAIRTQIVARDDALEVPRYVPGMTDGSPQDEHVFVRGNHRLLGPLEPRGFLEALGGARQPIARGSGRLELARRIADPANPFTARVAVNRVWHHLFGRGIAPTVDNFGVLGEPPSHPELLDWLARTFVADGWSRKRLIRRIVLSATYRQTSAPHAADEHDPEVRLLHRMPVRRLEGEAIRDAILAVSERLDRTRFGPSVPVHLTPFMSGRGRPKSSGPLDGDGRRSVYLEVRRNFLSPFFLAYDTPMPFATVGRRSVSNVPAQALALLNDPFVVDQAARWADAVAATHDDDAGRVDAMYRTALGRPPHRAELDAALEFVAAQAAARADGDDRTAWADLGHALFNVKEFVYLR